MQTKTSQKSQQQQQQRISGNFLPTPATVETTVRSFYPTPRPSPKPSQSSVTHQVTQHIHVSPGVTVSQLKPHQITINLPPPDIQRIVQNPSPLLPSQSRVIVTAKASVSDESGRPLNTTQLVTLPLPTIPASYDDYKEGDESFDPFYRDVPKIRKNRQDTREEMGVSRGKRSLEQPYHFIYGVDSREDGDFKAIRKNEPCGNEDNATNKGSTRAKINIEDFRALRESLIKFRDILFSNEANEDTSRNDTGEIKNSTKRVGINNETFVTTSVKSVDDNTIKKNNYLEDLKTEGSKHLSLNKDTDEDEEEDSAPVVSAEKLPNNEKHIKHTSELELENYTETTTARPRKKDSREDVIDIIILDNDFKEKATSAKTDAPIEIIIEEGTKSGTHNATSKANKKVAHREQIVGHLIKNESEKRSNSIAGEERQLVVPRETIKQKGTGGSGERKSSPRRNGSRSRSSRRRISSRIRQQKTENFEVTEAIQQKEDMEQITTTPNNIAATIVDTTTIPTTTSTTTVTSSVAPFETKVTDQIDSTIFGETESQTFKQVDMRAIDQRNTMSSQDSKSSDISKNKELERSFDHQIMENHTQSSDLRDETKEGKRETKLTDYTQSTDEEDTTFFTENPRSMEEAETTEVTSVYDEGFSSMEYVFPDDDEADTSTYVGETEESSQDIPSTSDEVVSSREGNLEQEESFYREDSSERSSTDVSNEEGLTSRYSEEVNSEELNEYQDTTESSAESTRGIQEDYRETESTEGSTTLADYTNFEEYIDSLEDLTTSAEETDGSTEGVLKFTDELPLSDDKDIIETTEETSARSDESGAHDYVDDNYEPENYKGTETTMRSEESEQDKNKEKEEKNDKKKEDTLMKDPNRTKNIETQQTDDSVETETQTEYAVDVTKINDLQEMTTLSTTTAALTTLAASTTTAASITTVASLTTVASTTTPLTTTASSTTASSTITTTITTPRPKSFTRRSTTTPRATPPKLFKPTGNRRIYAYSPPTTTPNPVVIKPRVGLFNPKPSKPLKTYNDLAPKPTIRKLVLSRKSTIEPTTTTILTTEEKLNTENLEMMTEPMTMTTATAETTTVTTTAAATTMTETATTTATLTTTTTVAATTMATPTTTVAATTTITAEESSRSEENNLESKLERDEHISLDPPVKNDQTDKEDQLSSSSEQNTSTNSSQNVDTATTTTNIDAFTPYSLSKSSILASSAEQTTEMNAKSQETTENIFVTTVLPTTTLLPEKSVEITKSTEKYREVTEITTTASTSKVYQQETSSISSIPPIPERATSVSIKTTILPKVVDADTVASMEAAILKSSGRKPVKSRKHPSFNCLEKEMYRFYGDIRDCRLFHYCSPGFTSRQVLDFRFVCEEGTAFDEVTQSCRHDVRNRKCRNRSW